MAADRRSGVIALVPLRVLNGGKTRLAGALPPEAREALTRRMLRIVVCAAVESRALAAVAVVSPDPAALAFAAGLGPDVVPLPQDPAAPGLNPALDAGRAWAQASGAATLLVLLGDLPLLTPTDAHHVVALAGGAPVVLAPDRHGSGTNALLLPLAPAPTPDARFSFKFGPDSRARHEAEARRLGLPLALARTRGLAFDLDTPSDLQDAGGGMWDAEEGGCGPNFRLRDEILLSSTRQ